MTLWSPSLSNSSQVSYSPQLLQRPSDSVVAPEPGLRSISGLSLTSLQPASTPDSPTRTRQSIAGRTMSIITSA